MSGTSVAEPAPAEAAPIPSEQVAATVPTVVIEPPRGWAFPDFREVWAYRELIALLLWRAFVTRYRQTLLGGLWAIIKPLGSTVVFSLVFGGLAKLPSDGSPYPVFVYAALLPWGLFSGALTAASNSVVDTQYLLTKVYVPRLVMPLAAVIQGLPDFLIGLIILVGMALYFGMPPTLNLLLIPVFVLLALGTAFAVALWVAPLYVEYRDTAQLVSFATTAWMWATPVVYALSLVPERWRTLYALNPMVWVIEGFRWAVLGRGTPPSPLMAVSVAALVVVSIGGLLFFRRMEHRYADVV